MSDDLQVDEFKHVQVDELTEALETMTWGWADDAKKIRRIDGPDVHLILRAARAYSEGRLPPDFPTDEDVEAAAELLYERRWVSRLNRDDNKNQARAALLAVAERRKT